jgi:hypothetical protein
MLPCCNLFDLFSSLFLHITPLLTTYFHIHPLPLPPSSFLVCSHCTIFFSSGSSPSSFVSSTAHSSHPFIPLSFSLASFTHGSASSTMPSTHGLTTTVIEPALSLHNATNSPTQFTLLRLLCRGREHVPLQHEQETVKQRGAMFINTSINTQMMKRQGYISLHST